ncbi:MAG: hypothetical protein KBG46_12955 [Paracoccus sp.]|nr:hypothetical protein [Paracoccus sp. (in: a-proteobacteria)]
MTNESALFTRLAQTHRPDCLLSLDGPPPQPAPDPGELARTLGSDAVAAYASACRPIYEDLRRIIGQCAGLAILARLTSRNEIRDLPELAQCEARWKAAAERLAALPSPGGVAGHRAQLEHAHGFSGLALRTFLEIRGREGLEAALDLAGLQIKRAYAHLEAASAAKAGLQMVDFTHACCACAH